MVMQEGEQNLRNFLDRVSQIVSETEDVPNINISHYLGVVTPGQLFEVFKAPAIAFQTETSHRFELKELVGGDMKISIFAKEFIKKREERNDKVLKGTYEIFGTDDDQKLETFNNIAAHFANTTNFIVISVSTENQNHELTIYPWGEQSHTMVDSDLNLHVMIRINADSDWTSEIANAPWREPIG